MICDICIVHLNVSYHLKKQATDNDMKIKRYIIEKGLMLNNSPSCTALVPFNSIQRNNTMPMPIQIKEEPVCIEDITHSVIDLETPNYNNDVNVISIIENEENPITQELQKEKELINNRMESVMVIIEDSNFLKRATAKRRSGRFSDTDFINSYIDTNKITTSLPNDKITEKQISTNTNTNNKSISTPTRRSEIKKITPSKTSKTNPDNKKIQIPKFKIVMKQDKNKYKDRTTSKKVTKVTSGIVKAKKKGRSNKNLETKEKKEILKKSTKKNK